MALYLALRAKNLSGCLKELRCSYYFIGVNIYMHDNQFCQASLINVVMHASNTWEQIEYSNHYDRSSVLWCKQCNPTNKSQKCKLFHLIYTGQCLRQPNHSFIVFKLAMNLRFMQWSSTTWPLFVPVCSLSLWLILSLCILVFLSLSLYAEISLQLTLIESLYSDLS